jgi:hypothetical protein
MTDIEQYGAGQITPTDTGSDSRHNKLQSLECEIRWRVQQLLKEKPGVIFRQNGMETAIADKCPRAMTVAADVCQGNPVNSGGESPSLQPSEKPRDVNQEGGDTVFHVRQNTVIRAFVSG